MVLHLVALRERLYDVVVVQGVDEPLESGLTVALSRLYVLGQNDRGSPDVFLDDIVGIIHTQTPRLR